MNTITTLPLSGLKLDKVNVRNVGRGNADPEFIASIRAKGVKLPLLVRPNGVGHVVVDGGKRLAALQELAKRGEVQADHPVPVSIEEATDAEAREDSLTLNVIRSAMHPVDEYRAFAKLDIGVEAIAARFGLTLRHVEQRLALGSLDAKILDAWRDGKLRADAAQAFTLCPDKKSQVRILDKLLKQDRQATAWGVKEELKIGHDNVGFLLNAIGIEAYEARGGKVTRDLFGDDHGVSDPALVDVMLGEKAEAERERLLAEGWAWVIDRPADYWNYGHLDPKSKPSKTERATLDALREIVENEESEEAAGAAERAEVEYDALAAEIKRRAFTPEQKKKSGCFLHVAGNGAIHIECGVTRPSPRKQDEPARDAKGTAEKPKEKQEAKLSKALSDRLSIQLAKATQTAVLDEKYSGSLSTLFARLVAKMIEPERMGWGTPSTIATNMDAIRKQITPKVFNGAIRRTFDASDYFTSAPKGFLLAAIREAVNQDEARKLLGKSKTEIAKFAIANVTKTGWLPAQLRTVHYDGPSGKAKAKAKKSR